MKNHSKIVCIKLVHLPYLYIWCTVTLTQYLWFQQYWCWAYRCPGPAHTCPEWLEHEGTTFLPNDMETLIEWHTVTFWFQTFAVFWMLYAVFWVIPRRLNFICQRFWTHCGTDSVPKRWHIKFTRRGIAQKKAYNTSLLRRPEFSVIITICLSHVVLTCYAEGIKKNNLFQQSVPLHQAPFLVSYFYWPS